MFEMEPNRHFYVKNFIRSQIFILQPTFELSRTDIDKIIPKSSIDCSKKMVALIAKRKFEKKLNSAFRCFNMQRKKQLSSIFTRQALNHVSFQLLDAENNATKFVRKILMIELNEKDMEVSESLLKQHYKDRYYATSYQRLKKIIKVFLESGIGGRTANNKLLCSFERYIKEHTRYDTYKVTIKFITNEINLINLPPAISDHKLLGAIESLHPLTLRVTAKLVRNSRALMN